MRKTLIDAGTPPPRRAQAVFHLPIAAAAKELNVGLTLLKRRCRALNIDRWPHRRISSVRRILEDLGTAAAPAEGEAERARAPAGPPGPGLLCPAPGGILMGGQGKDIYFSRRDLNA